MQAHIHRRKFLCSSLKFLVLKKTFICEPLYNHKDKVAQSKHLSHYRQDHWGVEGTRDQDGNSAGQALSRSFGHGEYQGLGSPALARWALWSQPHGLAVGSFPVAFLGRHSMFLSVFSNFLWFLCGLWLHRHCFKCPPTSFPGSDMLHSDCPPRISDPYLSLFHACDTSIPRTALSSGVVWVPWLVAAVASECLSS